MVQEQQRERREGKQEVHTAYYQGTRNHPNRRMSIERHVQGVNYVLEYKRNLYIKELSRRL